MSRSKAPIKNPYPQVPASIVTRDIPRLIEPTGNIYESLNVISRRARQVSNNLKEEISDRMSEFTTGMDNLEEVHENREQIEISKFYERLPKPTLIAIDEFLEGKLVFRRNAEDELHSTDMQNAK